MSSAAIDLVSQLELSTCEGLNAELEAPWRNCFAPDVRDDAASVTRSDLDEELRAWPAVRVSFVRVCDGTVCSQ